ncbi:MAG: DUF814 domain-containing protein [Nanoarchaeota archaeon]|nr:DUF814 domain-containing protein [Nanoarchaeota archaeon]
MEITTEKLIRAQKEKTEEKEITIKKIRKKEWYEKFRWFVSSEGLLVIGGRDATTNEIVIKKHADKNDVVFHTDMAGSPFVVIKSDEKKISQSTMQEASDFTACYSRAWREGLTTLDVFYVKPEQVSKEAKAGEYMTKGSFMITGKTNYLPPKMNLAVGVYEEKIMAGPVSAIKKHCKECVEIMQGDKKTSDVAKKIKKKIGGDLDEVIRVLPAGGCDVK